MTKTQNISAVLITTLFLVSCSNKPTVDTPISPDKYESICVESATEQPTGRMSIDMFAPTIGVETVEDVSKETYKDVLNQIGTCK